MVGCRQEGGHQARKRTPATLELARGYARTAVAWLAANGMNPMTDAKVITVPPPQMVANMRVGNMDGYCVGEPWGHRAIADGIAVREVGARCAEGATISGW